MGIEKGRLMLAALLAAAIAGCGGGEGGGNSAAGAEAGAGPAAGRFDAGRAIDDVEAQVALGPRPAGSAASRRLTEMLARRLRAAGLEDVRIQRPHRNVVATIPGEEPGTIVVGAHHDTVDIPGFVGANDGASGVAVVLELARTLPAPLDGPSIEVALFDAEEARPGRSFDEDGTRGSSQYVRYASDGGRQGAPDLDEIEAMVLFDLVGDCELVLPREANSDPGLYAEFEQAAGELASAGVLDPEQDPFGGTTTAISDDHVPFVEAGVPAVDLIDFKFGPGGSPGAFWHTTDDTLDKVCASSLDAVGETALRALPQIAR